MTRFSHAFLLGFLHCIQFILSRDLFFNGYHLKCNVLGCCLNWYEECVKSVCFTGEDSGGRLTKSDATTFTAMLLILSEASSATC